MHTELLAVIADRTGVGASSKQYQEPPKPIQRPAWLTDGGEPKQQDQNPFTAAINRLRASAKRVVT